MVKNKQNEETIKADFNINRLQMDAKLCWLLDLEVKKVLPETYLHYTLELVFNEQPYLDAIKRIEGEIEEVEKEASLFNEGKAQIIQVLVNKKLAASYLKSEIANLSTNIDKE